MVLVLASFATLSVLSALVVPWAVRGPTAEERVPARRIVYPDRLPEGPGREIAEASCLLCHSASLLTQQAKDSTAWSKTLTQMELWQAPVAPAQRDSLLAYLVSSLGRRPATTPAPKTP